MRISTFSPSPSAPATPRDFGCAQAAVLQSQPTQRDDTPSRDLAAWTLQGLSGSTWVTVDTQSVQFAADPGRFHTTEYTLDQPNALFSG